MAGKARNSELDPWLAAQLVCPVDGSDLRFDGDSLISSAGRRYPVIQGVPVLLVTEERQTIELAETSIQAAMGAADPDDSLAGLYIETVGVSPEQRVELAKIVRRGQSALDPVAMMLIGATSGYAYEHLVGDEQLARYPIPDIALPPAANGERLLDIGCSWGRWCVAAGRKGYRAVGLDPSLGAVLAARRISRAEGLDNLFVVADGRRPPFRPGSFDTVYSYSVLQHFSQDDARAAFAAAGRVLKPGGTAKIQMAAKFGLRSLQHQAARRFRRPENFEVRYWTPLALREAFEQAIGPTRLSVDCYFGLGWQWADYDDMPPKFKPILLASELLRRISRVAPPLTYVADSIFCTARKPGAAEGL